jgi:hypothetical protein
MKYVFKTCDLENYLDPCNLKDVKLFGDDNKKDLEWEEG